MASSIIHLAVTKRLTEEFPFSDTRRLYLGCILPDGAADRNRAHMKRVLSPEGRRTYDVNAFRERFGELMEADDLYLGYYLHLVQDILFRRFMYAEHGWDPAAPGCVGRLHRDYAVTNAPIIRRYGLAPDMVRPLDPGPELAALGGFDIPRFVDTVRGYFTPVPETQCFFFTPELAEEYIERAVDLSRGDLLALRDGGATLDAAAWAWGGAGQG